MSTPTDSRLREVLALLREVHDEAKTETVLLWATNLLATLQSPYNLGLLTNQLLLSPAIWSRPAAIARPLATCMRVMTMFKSACVHVHTRNIQYLETSRYPTPDYISPELWSNAVAGGLAGGQTDRWKHLLVLVGLLSAIQSADAADAATIPDAARERAADYRLDTKVQLEHGVAKAINIGLGQFGQIEDTSQRLLAQAAMTLTVAHACPLLTETSSRYVLNLDALVPVALHAVTHHKEGLQNCAFMGGIGADAVFDQANRLHWPGTSKSFEDVQRVAANPLVGALGSLSKVLALAVSHTGSTEVIDMVLSDLFAISTGLSWSWGATRLSELEHDPAGLSAATREQTLPVLLQLQRNVMYACVVVLRAIVARAVWDLKLAPRITTIATTTLSVLRHLSFITVRPSHSSFEAYQATYMGAIDLLARRPADAFWFLKGISPRATTEGLVHASALDKTLDLFYMGLAEHLPLQLSQDDCHVLVIRPAAAILDAPHRAGLLDVALYETAHSAVLAVFACPQHSALTAGYALKYANTLAAAFPARISARQFQLGFKSVVKYMFPPHSVVDMGEQLASATLEMISGWAAGAGTTVLAGGEDGVAAAPMTEQGVLVLTLVDGLPFVPVADLEEWLVVVAQRLGEIKGSAVRAAVRERLMAVLANGELDVERAAVAAAWWGTHGGQRLVEGESRTQL
ncbi:hypothetical protein RB595_009107 [Gaeumannomyces hyphopodioides]